MTKAQGPKQPTQRLRTFTLGPSPRSVLAFRGPAGFAGAVFRKDLIPLLLGNPMSVGQIARLVGETPRDIEVHLCHLLQSLRHTGYSAVIEPARCRKCGFEFDASKLAKPSKCPECRSTWLLEPRVGLNESG